MPRSSPARSTACPIWPPCWRKGRSRKRSTGPAPPGREEADTGVALRRERLALALALAIGDLAGALPLLRVVGELSDFADRALDAGIAAAIRRRVPDADGDARDWGFRPSRWASTARANSTIRPTSTRSCSTIPMCSPAARDEPGEAAQRVARTLVELLSSVTAEGYVFRIDLRLRPASEVSPLALPFAGAITHYESSALAWERAAYIRARAASGDVARGRPFSTRSARLSGGAASISGRLPRSGD
jgi:glutamate-ammonia-ligase adenylyltransferase